jgi:hypothetical protein
VSILERQHAAKIFVQMRKFRSQRQRHAHGLFGLRVACLLRKGMAKQPQMVYGAGVAIEVVAADLLSP